MKTDACKNRSLPTACSRSLVFRGFCYFNSVAIAAKQLQQKLSVSKILIVDWVRQLPFCSHAAVFNYAGAGCLILCHPGPIARMFTMAMALRKCFTATRVFCIFRFIATTMAISSLAVGRLLRWATLWCCSYIHSNTRSHQAFTGLTFRFGAWCSGRFWSRWRLQCEYRMDRRSGPTHGRCRVPRSIQVRRTPVDSKHCKRDISNTVVSTDASKDVHLGNIFLQ